MVGLLPILLRFSAAVSSKDGSISYFSLSDIIFIGIIFNMSAITNALTEKGLTTLYWIIFGWGMGLSTFLLSLYTLQLVHEVNLYVGAPLVFILTLISFLLSFLASDSKTLQQFQTRLNAEEMLTDMPKSLQKRIKAVLDLHMDGQKISQEILVEIDNDVNQYLMLLKKKIRDTVNCLLTTGITDEKEITEIVKASLPQFCSNEEDSY
jgi:hypothetical protein